MARRLIRLRGLRPWPPAEGQGSRGAEEQGSGGGFTSAPPHPGTPAQKAPPPPGTGYIPIVYTGVRPGEKMHEELLGDGEERCPTAHPHIFRVRCNHISDRAAFRRQIDELIALAEAQRNGEVVARLREMVGEGRAGD